MREIRVACSHRRLFCSVSVSVRCFIPGSGIGVTGWGTHRCWSIYAWSKTEPTYNTLYCLSGLCCCLSGSRLWWFSERKSVCIVQCYSVALCIFYHCFWCSFPPLYWTQSRFVCWILVKPYAKTLYSCKLVLYFKPVAAFALHSQKQKEVSFGLTLLYGTK